MCDVLKEVYYNIFGEKFNYTLLHHRKKLQKAVYLLENMGISIGDYSFSWYEFELYSLRLDSEAKKCSLEEYREDISFSELAKYGFSSIKDYLSEIKEYPIEKGIECITSLHYMKCILKIEDDELIPSLVKVKPYFNNDVANYKAMHIINKIRVG